MELRTFIAVAMSKEGFTFSEPKDHHGEAMEAAADMLDKEYGDSATVIELRPDCD